MNSQTPSPSAKGSARRRLLRGSFAAPAVLMLSSGSALAAKSATCLAKETTSPSTAALVSSSSLDTLMRVKLRKRNDNNVHFVARDDLGGLNIALALWSTNTKWQKFGVSTSNMANYNKLYDSQRTDSVPGNSQVDLFVALRFDADGNVVGMGLSGSGSVIGQSCWTSIKASAG